MNIEIYVEFIQDYIGFHFVQIGAFLTDLCAFNNTVTRYGFCIFCHKAAE